MENVVKYFDTIEGSFKRTKFLTVSTLVAAAVVALGSLFYSASFVARHTDNIYLLDGNGGAASATVSSSTAVDRELEVTDHVMRFHELMFNLSPSSDGIRRNVDRALVMCDKSAYDYYNDLSEKGYYSRMVSANITQQISIDSVSVNMRVYPYLERTYGKVYIIRESNITQYDFLSQGQLIEIGRSKFNPHGLMLEKFQVLRNEKVQTRRRN